MNRKVLVMTLAAAMSLSLGATAAQAGETEQPSAKIGLILGTGGLGDKNFNDMGYAGALQAQEELGVEFDYVEPETASDYVSYGRQFAETEEYDLLVMLGAEQLESAQQVLAEFPDQKISVIDCTAEADGISTMATIWQQQTFVSGVLAGLGTVSDMDLANDDNVIGVITGQDNPTLRLGVLGFEAGAKWVNPEVEVLKGDVGDFNDPGKGKEIALSMYNKGADFVQHIAGGSGLGVFEAASEANAYAFGVGTNQNSIDPDHIVASSTKKVDQMVYGEISKVLDGTWEAGQHVSGLKEGTVGCVTDGSNVVIPDDILEAMKAAQEGLLSGELEVPASEDDLEDWVKNNQYKAE